MRIKKDVEPLAETTPTPLKHLTPLVAGSTRLVFPHPNDSGLLIKVMRPEVLERHKGGGGVKSLRRDRPVKIFLREIREQLVLAAWGETPAWFVQQIKGFNESDLGPGIIVEALRGREGQLAPTLRELLNEGRFDDEAKTDLARFVRALLESRIILCAVGLGNVVYACDGPHRRFVLVDGFGDRGFLPMKRWSQAANRRTKVRQLQWLTDEVERRARAAHRGAAPARGAQAWEQKAGT